MGRGLGRDGIWGSGVVVRHERGGEVDRQAGVCMACTQGSGTVAAAGACAGQSFRRN